MTEPLRAESVQVAPVEETERSQRTVREPDAPSLLFRLIVLTMTVVVAGVLVGYGLASTPTR